MGAAGRCEMVSLDFDRLDLAAGDALRVVGPFATESLGRPDDNLVRRALLVGRTADVTSGIPAGAGWGSGSSGAGLRWAGFTDLDAAAQLGATSRRVVGGGPSARDWRDVDPLPFQPLALTLVTPPVFVDPTYRAGRTGGRRATTATTSNRSTRCCPDLALATNSPMPPGNDPALEERSTWFVEGVSPMPDEWSGRCPPPRRARARQRLIIYQLGRRSLDPNDEWRRGTNRYSAGDASSAASSCASSAALAALASQ